MNIEKIIKNYRFSREEVAGLKEYRDKQNDPDLKLRFVALLLFAENTDFSVIISATGKSRKTLKRWFETYILSGSASLASYNYKPKKSFMTDDQTKYLISWVKENHPADAETVRDFIKDRFGVAYCTDAVRKILKKNGLRFFRAKTVPGNPPSEEEQRRFTDEYNKIRQLAQTGVTVLFCDAMHLIHQTEPSFGWGDPKDPPVFPTNSGRRRLNILGAYNPATYALLHHTGEANCDAGQIIVFFEKILKKYRSSSFIVLYADNAPYFHARKVSERLEKHPEIIIRFLPPYAPDLNLIERLWRFVKKKTVKNRYVKEYKTFRCSVFRILNNILKYKNELITLMTEKFEIVTYVTG